MQARKPSMRPESARAWSHVPKQLLLTALDSLGALHERDQQAWETTRLCNEGGVAKYETMQ